MKLSPQAIQQALNALGERPIKRSALAFFRVVRAASNRAKETPGVLTQAVNDVREAWQESAQPPVEKERPC